MSAISAQGVTKKFGDATVLHGIDLDVPYGEMFALLGPNGSGKTTLFRILATLILPSGGSAVVGGCDAVGDPAGVRSKIGVVFQSPSLDKKLTARENLRYGGALHGLHGAILEARVSELAEALRIEDKLESLVETLSGGQQRRVEIAKCLLDRPEILLLDEPSTGLDPAARADLWSLVANLRATHGMTVVFTSHLMDESARADRVGIMCGGRLVRVDRPPVLLAEAGPEVLRVATPAAKAVADFLRATCGLAPHALENEVRVSAKDPHGVAVRLTNALPAAVESTTVSKPTLEDVFLFQTGKPLNE